VDALVRHDHRAGGPAPGAIATTGGRLGGGAARADEVRLAAAAQMDLVARVAGSVPPNGSCPGRPSSGRLLSFLFMSSTPLICGQPSWLVLAVAEAATRPKQTQSAASARDSSDIESSPELT
jgi:hypothetical protein